jgi:hypothetical protein
VRTQKMTRRPSSHFLKALLGRSSTMTMRLMTPVYGWSVAPSVLRGHALTADPRRVTISCLH